MQEPAGQGRLISIIMANHQGARYLRAALASVLAQTHDDWELIVADDGSSDGSVEILQDAAAQDARVRVLLWEKPSGPAAARNRALAVAQGAWLAICDSDDIMHPDRLRRLLVAAERLGADAVADDMIHFATEPMAAPRSVFGPEPQELPREISPADMLRVPEPGEAGAQLGYIKPLIRREALGALSYDETLTIGEDQDLYLRLLLRGGRLWLLPEALYLYRRHPQSLSHRSSRAHIEASLAALEGLSDRLEFDQHTEIKNILNQRRRVLQRRLSFEMLAENLKERRLASAVGQVLRDPSLVSQLARVALAKARGPKPGQEAERAFDASAEVVHLVGPDGASPALSGDSAGARIAVPMPEEDGSHSALWADLCHRASRGALTLTYGDVAGLSAAWRVPAAVHVRARGPVASDLPPPKGQRDG
ncbi:glycosyltransferase family 2 protein [Phaeobacter gallaeciensis]|uniref:Glycosyltransferase involved in cell wall biogenesis n=1 Tax=Phaeobacter gallaeciensis TaxID=60890 RepID=A0AAD0EEP5_9RHOB|nr:glycosyltransferase family 2 protein [Phaeobacter gallaeciensis]AHD11437.1 Glycosyltransferase involved in cell wall biogenesis [Phaeobacter gallaeciensis DSM 26640]ATE94701.1 Glycosyltransferase involved in cell wall biogenesis [Phaeobacter gallaeciensis]ATE98973.1 Glycosyltransferase involved in cell wall biogenesis [Phaeobacter gallaeciensis]ATF07745.1 Glycosyltransferase involved in cell wall biogenesis [Phaeobacter gallaeciensis]